MYIVAYNIHPLNESCETDKYGQPLERKYGQPLERDVDVALSEMERPERILVGLACEGP